MAKKKSPAELSIEAMLDEVRGAVGRCRDASEKDVLEVLMAEAEGWEMRLQEIEKEGQEE